MKKIVFITLIVSALLAGCDSKQTDIKDEVSSVEVQRDVYETKPVKEIVFSNEVSTEVNTDEQTEEVISEANSDNDIDSTMEDNFASDLSEEEIYDIISKAFDSVEGQEMALNIKHDAVDYQEEGISIKMGASDSTMYIDKDNNMHLDLSSEGEHSDMWLIGNYLYLNENGYLSKGELKDSGSSTEEVAKSVDINKLKESYMNPKMIAKNKIEFEVSQDNSMQEMVSTVEGDRLYKAVMELNDDGSFNKITMKMDGEDQANYSITMFSFDGVIELPMSFDNAEEMSSDDAAWAFMMAFMSFMM